METTESIKRRIRTAEDLHSLVKTMKALAAVNIRQLEHAVESLDHYNRTVELGLRVLLRKHPEVALTARPGRGQRLGAVVFGSDQGMCGPLNDQIVSFALQQLAQLQIAPDDRSILAVGQRAATRLEDAGMRLEAIHPVPSSTAGILAAGQDVLLRIEDWHRHRQMDRVVLFYSEHLSLAAYRQKRLNLLPIDRVWLGKLAEQQWPTRILPAFTMDASRLFSLLVRQYLFVSLYRALAESLASENASRLTSMRGAERNIENRIGELTSHFHQQRQMAITEELLDIASGFESMNRPAGE